MLFEQGFLPYLSNTETAHQVDHSSRESGPKHEVARVDVANFDALISGGSLGVILLQVEN